MTITNHSIIILRHGQSTWNQRNLFTGWEDADITHKGEIEASKAGKLLKKNNLKFDVAFTSFLRRAIKTLWIVLNEIDQVWIPVHKCWKLNERHYGHLTGLNKFEMEKKYGANLVKKWRKSYHYSPKPIDVKSPIWSGYDNRYDFIPSNELPLCESLKITVDRVAQFWDESVIPNLKKNKRVLISAHGNSLRALIMHIENITSHDIENLDIPRAKPIILELDKNFRFLSREFL